MEKSTKLSEMGGWYFLLQKAEKGLDKRRKNAAKPFGTRNSKGLRHMDKYPIQLRETANKLIGWMKKSAYLFSKSGEKDFVRKRKIPFSKLIQAFFLPWYR